MVLRNRQCFRNGDRRPPAATACTKLTPGGLGGPASGPPVLIVPVLIVPVLIAPVLIAPVLIVPVLLMPVLRVPAYSPHLNPIERLWGVMHQALTHNRCYDNFAKFRTKVLTFLRYTVPAR